MRWSPEERGNTGLSSKDLYLRLLSHVKPYSKQFILALGFTMLLATTDPMLAYFLEPLINGTFVDRDPGFLVYAPLGLIAIFAVRGLAGFASTVLFSWISGRLVYDLREAMFASILKLPTSYFDATGTGVLINKLTHNVMQVTNAATKVLTTLVRDSITVIGLMGFMIWKNWKFSIIVFVIMPVIMLVIRTLASRLRKIHRQRQAAMGELTHSLGEAVRGQKVIKIYGGQKDETKRFKDVANWVRRWSFKDKVADAVNIPLVEMAAAIMIAVLIYLGTGENASDPMSVGEFVAFMAALGMLFPPLKRLTRVNQPLQAGLAGAESVFGLIDEPAEVDKGSRALSLPVKGALSFQQVSFSYGEDLPDALTDITFDVAPGETVALVGSSGSGKTTISALVPRLYDATRGEIQLDGVPLNELRLADLRAQISYVGQEAILFNDTIAANIAYGQPGDIDQASMLAAAEAAHALDFIRELPEGFDAQVGEDGVRLSGGQRQRIAIARAILKNAPVLVLDEATSALDTESERHVQEALDELSRDKTTLVIAHRLSTIENADRILVVKDGRIVEVGTHDELLAKHGEYEKLYNRRKDSAKGSDPSPRLLAWMPRALALRSSI
ncbi:MAG: lipid A export permease/ATP-binding protein MsbA [bacterium]